MTADRRRGPRDPARECWGRLEWAEGPEVRGARFRLLDVGRGGAGLKAERPVPVGRQVWIRLEGPAPTGWASARVTRAGADLGAGVAFVGDCPFEFRMAATLGIAFGHLF